MKGDNPIVDYVPYDMWLDHETIQCAECFAMFLLIRDMAGLLRGAFRTLVFSPESGPLSLTCNITVGLGHAVMIYTVWYVLMHRHVWFKIFQVTSSQSSGTYIYVRPSYVPKMACRLFDSKPCPRQCWPIANWTIAITFQWNLNRNTKPVVHGREFEKFLQNGGNFVSVSMCKFHPYKYL